MRVAIDPYIFSIQVAGGISRYFASLAEGISRAGHDLSVVAGIHRNIHLANTSGVRVSGAYWRTPWRYTTRALLCLNSQYSRYEIGRIKPSVVHETYYSGRDAGYRNIPSVVTVHDMIHELFPGDFPGNDSTSSLKRASVSRARHVICVSENTKNDLLRLCDLRPERVSVVHHGVTPLSTEFLVKPLDIGRPYFLYVGNRGGYKNFRRFVQAFALSKDLVRSASVLCFGGGAFGADEANLINSLGLDSVVSHMYGADSDLASAYRGAIALVYPSTYEGFGLPPLEAMQNGCAVTCSNVSSIPEVVGDAGLYFDPTDEDSIADSLQRMLTDRTMRTNYIQRGYARAKKFSSDTCISATLSAYERAS